MAADHYYYTIHSFDNHASLLLTNFIFMIQNDEIQRAYNHVTEKGSKRNRFGSIVMLSWFPIRMYLLFITFPLLFSRSTFSIVNDRN